MIRTIGFPGRYVQGPGALGELPALLKEFASARPVVIMDDAVMAAAGDAILGAISKAGVAASRLRFPGECTAEAIAALAKAAGRDVDMVIGFGGGKTIDAAKGVAKALGSRLFIVPSIASNDSPTSRLIVLYDEEHRVAGVQLLVRNPDVVLVDTAIVAKAPVRFFVAGLGDALSKQFEATQCDLAGGRNFFGTPSLPTARLLARQCYETILEFGPAAVSRLRDHGTPDESVERTVEASVLLSGLGFESGGLSLAHALTRGFTAHPAMSKFLHGELVAFGSIVQLVAEERPEHEVVSHARFCRRLGLPVSFDDLGAEGIGQAELCDIASRTAAAPYIGNLRPAADADRIVECLRRADALGARG